MKNKIKKLLRENLLIETLFHGTNRKELNWNDRNPDPDYNMLGYGIYLTDIQDEAKYYANKKQEGIKYIHTFKPINANIVNWDGPLPESILAYIKNNPNFFNGGNDVDFEDYSIETSDGSLEWDYIEDPIPDWAKADNGKSGYFIIKYDSNGNQVGKIKYGLTKEQVLSIANQLSSNRGISFEIEPSIFYGITGIKNDELNTQNMLLSIANFYTFLYYKLGSTKKASEFLVNLGIDGVTKQQDTSDFGYSEEKPNVTVIYNPNKFKKINTDIVN